jgi:hypothetical protein
MSDEKSEKPAPKPKAGCGAKLLFLILLLGIAGLGTALYFISKPQDLTDIEGYGSPTSIANVTTPRRDIKEVLQNALDRNYPVTLTEREINLWLARTVKPRQAGLLEKHVTLKGVYIRLEDGRAEVVMERDVMGYPLTTSMFLQIEQLESSTGINTQVHLHGGPFHESLPYPPQGGRLGQLRIPQGFLMLTMKSFENLAAIFPTEVELGFEKMARFKIEEGKITLDPRAPTREVELPSSF